MLSHPAYPKRLIEVDLPIKTISEHARREKSIRHGHISTLHVWWARRPLAACRAVICAALWPDPADPFCPESFKTEAKKQMTQFWNQMDATACNVNDSLELRSALLDFIADFANWDNSTKQNYLNTARALTLSAHVSLGGKPGTRPLVVDPFAGGGAIPLEALRVGADAYASDLNPVAVLLNKMILEIIPVFGQDLADEVRKWGQWVKTEAEKELLEYYPKDPDGSTPIAYLWARTVKCEGPGCGAEIPLIRSLWLAKRSRRGSVAIKLIPNPIEKKVDFAIINDATPVDVKDGTVKRGSATCPCCGYTTPVVSVRKQLKARRGGADDARMFCVISTKPSEQGRFFRLPTKRDFDAVNKAKEELVRRKREWTGELSLVPDEPTPMGGGSGAGRAFSQRNYGMNTFEDLFSQRELLALTTILKEIKRLQYSEKFCVSDDKLRVAIITCLAFALNRQADFTSSLASWWSGGEKIQHTFTRQAIPIVWDFVECNPLSSSTGSWDGAYNWGAELCEHGAHSLNNSGKTFLTSADRTPHLDDTCNLLLTDPPYYDAVPYADLSDFFYVWMRRSIGEFYPEFLSEELTPKKDECIVDEVKGKDKQYFENLMKSSMAEARRILTPHGVGVVVFANKSTSGWEAQLQAMVDAGWTITGSWPIDTEMGTRLRAMNSAALASSIHIVCRPRENPDGSVRSNDVGEWRDVLHELPIRLHEWMPRLAAEGVVGADAIFACLGPALEIYSRYSRVENPNGEPVLLHEYLEKVWEAVAREAITVIFHDADTSGFEEDARLTAMWLWTLSTGGEQNGAEASVSDEEDSGDDEDKSSSKKTSTKGGFTLEYDTARKIAQGLGAHPEEMRTLVEVKGDTARLLPVSERAQFLFGKQGVANVPVVAKRKGKQLTLGESTGDEADKAVVSAKASMEGDFDLVLGKTVLDSVHQSMLLFGAGRSDALKTFLVDNGAGKDPRFWRLAQALSALYPKSCEEKRWVDGVLARKKGLGL